MNYSYHVYTPFSRHKVLPMFFEMIRTMPIIWHPVFMESERPELPDLPWIEPMICDSMPEDYSFWGSWKKNWFLDHVNFEDDARYLMLNDDDFYEPGFFQKIDAAKGEFLVCSMARGASEHSLVAAAYNMRGACVADEQLCLSGKIQREFRFGKHYAGDWDMINEVMQKHEPHFVPSAWVWFNYLQAGRWKNKMTYQDDAEFETLLRLFNRLPAKRRVLEIGSLHGETLHHWMNNMPRGGTIVSIDAMVPPSDTRHQVQADGHSTVWPQWARDNDLTFHCFNSDSRAPDTIKAVSKLLPEIDFLMIDGGHDGDTCRSDWQNYGRLVRPGGLVAFHDLGNEWPDVRGVWEEARQGHVSLELVRSPDRYGIGVLHV